MRGWRWSGVMLVTTTLTLGCTGPAVVYQVKPPLKPPPVRPSFTSPLKTEESRWILDVVKWGEYHCAEVAALRGDDPQVCRVE